MRAGEVEETLRTALALLASRLAGAPLGGGGRRRVRALELIELGPVAPDWLAGPDAAARLADELYERIVGRPAMNGEHQLPARRVHRLRARRLSRTSKRVIPFRFNPESLSRTVASRPARAGGGVEGAAPGAAAAPPGRRRAPTPRAARSRRASRSRSALDFADRDESVSGLDEEFGIAPEIAAIEDLLYPAETETEASSDGTEPVRPARPRPTVLFVWGRKRVLPVRIVVAEDRRVGLQQPPQPGARRDRGVARGARRGRRP